ncbi:hypothetical protein E0Z10_g4964 [Xylaria hypoxylon]|uniref:J domain-containing protein n=1 Tax=Xylaria hypoxylon TaxID=37992 RepID=A0A4Z0YV15_9PEZI|nr:hypothetical protein E0Z10_g4964 [Xylaria hypoxylon]
MGVLHQPPTSVDYYADLGLSQTASPQEVRHAFYKIAKETHPDKNGNEPTHTARFRKAREAYECLGDVTRRSIYDSKYYSIHHEWSRYRELIKSEVKPAPVEQRREDNYHLKMGGYPSACAEQNRPDNYHLKMGGGFRLKVEVVGIRVGGCNAASRNLDDFFSRWQRTQFSFMTQVRC